MIGHRFSRESHELKDFLARNNVPYRWLDVELDPEAQVLLGAAGGGGGDACRCWCSPTGRC